MLGRSIFIRYLEDRRILEPKDLVELGQPESLQAALGLGWNSLSAFFVAMSDHFNGDVFRRDVLTRPLPDEALHVLSNFFHGADLETGQAPLWRYDFAIIPPELISSIYEQLLAPKQKSDAAYYTPRRIVDLVLDELLPRESSLGTRTVLDPACGSGIFLTEAFRRLVRQRKALKKTMPGYEELSALLVDSVFGVDRNSDAIGVTAFGLYLALLEHVDPRTIWREVKLPRLVGSNLIVSDFFEENALSNRSFDVIAGNPPWQSALTPAANQYLKRTGHHAPDRQIAVPFIWKAAEMLRPGGVVGLVLPAKTVLHNRGGTADVFRTEFFGDLDVQTVIDLSPLRKELFGASSPATIVIYRANVKSAHEQILHVSPRRTPISEIIDGIAIPQQNIQRVSRTRAQMDPSIWKTLLWGGSQDVSLVSHLRETFETLGTYANARSWQSGVGYQIVNRGDQNDATHLHGIPQILTSSLEAMRAPIQSSLQDPVTVETMHRPREKAIYRAPHILMRKGFSRTPHAAFIEYDATFTDGLFALAGPDQEERLLRAIAAVLNSSVAHYWYLMTSSSWGVEREQLHQREWLSLPLPELSEETIGLLCAVNAGSSGSPRSDDWRETLDRIVEADVYQLADHERQLITDTLEYGLSEMQFGALSDAYDAPESAAFADYARALKTHMDGFEVGEWSVGLSETTNGFARMTCEHRSDLTQASSKTRFTVDELLRDDEGVLGEGLASSIIVEPQAVILDRNKVHIVKPNRRTNWAVSSAVDDAADVFDAMLRNGSETMRGRFA